MKKQIKRIAFCAFAAAIVWGAALLSDRQQLRESLIRFHVVANSDSTEDQQIKLRVRDAVLEGIQQDLEKLGDREAALSYLQENLPKIRKIADDTLHAAGFAEKTVVSLCEEAFDTRYYDTFSLPAGVYESLRIVIGEGEGKNWWCVAFPSLCIPATSDGFEDTAVGAGFSETLTDTLTEDGYRIRFYFLDVLGRLENILF